MAGEVEQDIFRALLKHFGGKFSGHSRFEAYGFGLWSAFQTWGRWGLLQTGAMAGPLPLAGPLLVHHCEMASEPYAC